MMRAWLLRWIVIVLLSVVLPGCRGSAMAEDRSLVVTISSSDPGSDKVGGEITVQLLDISRADARSTQIARVTGTIASLPSEMRIDYDVGAIDPRMVYAVSAMLSAADGATWRTTTRYPVLTRGAPDHVAIVLERTASAASDVANRISGIEWAAFEIGGRALVTDDPPTIAFLEDGSFTLFGGCNRFRGMAEMGAGRIQFPQSFAGTRMLCPAGRMELERKTLEALGSTTGYTRHENRLSLMNGTGVTVARFIERPE
jgi:putative lipoprotein